MKEVHVVGAALRCGTKVLAAQRSVTMGAPLKWEFAGGKVEEEETHEEALKRELLEELCIEAEIGDFLAEGRNEEADRVIILHVYEASIVKGEPKALEHSQLKWVEINGLGELDWAEADIPACKELMRKYGSIC